MSDKPRFSVHVTQGRGDVYIDDDVFHYDASLRLMGDFPSDAEMLAYAQAVADALNKAKVPGKL